LSSSAFCCDALRGTQYNLRSNPAENAETLKNAQVMKDKRVQSVSRIKGA
jgi:hypothetical protein